MFWLRNKKIIFFVCTLDSRPGKGLIGLAHIFSHIVQNGKKISETI